MKFQQQLAVASRKEGGTSVSLARRRQSLASPSLSSIQALSRPITTDSTSKGSMSPTTALARPSSQSAASSAVICARAFSSLLAVWSTRTSSSVRTVTLPRYRLSTTPKQPCRVTAATATGAGCHRRSTGLKLLRSNMASCSVSPASCVRTEAGSLSRSVITLSVSPSPFSSI